ncbi:MULTISPECIES: YolD-like family protein [Brevibacillus]|uniref:YolD-like family protein n=1 Tax=Brevibacillus TaxID=55080 RepID=UPI00363C9FCD
MAKATTPKRPTRDEFELEELGTQLIEAKDDGDERALTVWGMPEKVRGRITVLDSRTRLVHVEENETIRKIPFLDIMKVSYE